MKKLIQTDLATNLFLILTVLLTGQAFGQSSFQRCWNSVNDVTELDCDLPTVATGSFTTYLKKIKVGLVTEDGAICSFLFWTYNNRVYFPDDLPVEINIEADENTKAVAWYYCSEEGICPPQGCDFNTKIFGLDIINGLLLASPIVELVNPNGAEGDCFENNPCRTENNIVINSITAKVKVEDLYFKHWNIDNSNQRAIDLQPNQRFLIAFYGYEKKENNGERVGKRVDEGVYVPRGELLKDKLAFMYADKIAYEITLPKICHYVLDCPGCEQGYCPGFEIYFEGAELFNIEVFNNKSGKVISKAKTMKNGTKVLQFQPESLIGFDDLSSSYSLRFKGVEGKDFIKQVTIQTKLFVRKLKR